MNQRVELQMHTKSSDDLSTIGVDAVLDRAVEWDLSAVAFTNLNNVLDFQKVQQWCLFAQEPFRVLYGAQVHTANSAGEAPYRLTLLAAEQEGLTALNRVLSSLQDDGVCSLIDPQVLQQNRTHLLVGSAGNLGELYAAIHTAKAEQVARQYDYLEIYPTADPQEQAAYAAIYALGKRLGLPVVAVNNARCLDQDGALALEVLRTHFDLHQDNTQRMLDTEEMLSAFAYLGQAAAEDVVLTQPELVAQRCATIRLPKEKAYPPYEEATFDNLQTLCRKGAERCFGTPLPRPVAQRLEEELDCIRRAHAAHPYLTAKTLMDATRNQGCFAGVRGMVGSTLVGFVLGITPVNPLPPHYRCGCGYFALSDAARDGFDLPAQVCPTCGKPLIGDGHTIPASTFMGLTIEKEPDIDLVFPRDYYDCALQNLKAIYGKDNVVRASMVGLMHAPLAQRLLQDYLEQSGVTLEEERLYAVLEAMDQVKRRSNLHPGGYMIKHPDVEFERFTPLRRVQRPEGEVLATQLGFPSLLGTFYKQDLLQSAPVSMLHRLAKETGISPDDLPLNDPEVYAMLCRGEVQDIPGLDNDLTAPVFRTVKPDNFHRLVKALGLLHGTDVWCDNGEHLLAQGIDLESLPTLRDDVYNDLLPLSDHATAYRFSNAVRMGRLARGRLHPGEEERFRRLTQPLGDWYADFCHRVVYSFPKAHAAEQAINFLRLGWYKLHFPDLYHRIHREEA